MYFITQLKLECIKQDKSLFFLDNSVVYHGKISSVIFNDAQGNYCVFRGNLNLINRKKYGSSRKNG